MNNMRFDKFTPCHIIIRAVEGRLIFSNEEDCSRFIFQMYTTNIGKPGFNIFRKNILYIADKILLGEDVPWKIVSDKGSPIVDILSFALVGDHVHLILSPNVENGIPRYIHKINVSFAKYYNMKYNREGVLFNKPYKIIPLETSSQLEATMRYVNVKSPLDVYNKNWKNGVENWKEAFEFVEKYQYSSYMDLFGDRSSKMLAAKPILEKYLGMEINKNKIDNIDFIENYISEKLDYYYPVFLEENVKTL